MRKRIKNSLFLIILTLAAIFSTYNIRALAADTSDNKQVVVTVTTNENEASKLYNYLANNGYDVSTDGKQSITASLKKAEEVPTSIQQNKDETSSLTKLFSFDPIYFYGAFGITALILIVLFFVAKVLRRDKGYEEEYYEETYPQYPYYDQQPQPNYTIQGNNQCMNLFQRLEGMQVQPQCSAYYFNSNNNYYGDPFVQQRTDYSNYDDNSQFSIIRNRQR